MAVGVAVLAVGGWLLARRLLWPPGKQLVTSEIEALQDIVGEDVSDIDRFERTDAHFGERCDQQSDGWTAEQTLIDNHSERDPVEIVAAVVDRYRGPEVVMRRWRQVSTGSELLFVADLRRDMLVRVTVNEGSGGTMDVQVTWCGVEHTPLTPPVDGYDEVPLPP